MKFVFFFFLHNSIATFECRGVDIEEFEPRDGWQCEGAEDSKSKFTDVDLADDEFCDYGNEFEYYYFLKRRKVKILIFEKKKNPKDEQKDLPVSISDFKFKFEVA